MLFLKFFWLTQSLFYLLNHKNSQLSFYFFQLQIPKNNLELISSENQQKP